MGTAARLARSVTRPSRPAPRSSAAARETAVTDDDTSSSVRDGSEMALAAPACGCRALVGRGRPRVRGRSGVGRWRDDSARQAPSASAVRSISATPGRKASTLPLLGARPGSPRPSAVHTRRSVAALVDQVSERLAFALDPRRIAEQAAEAVAASAPTWRRCGNRDAAAAASSASASPRSLSETCAREVKQTADTRRGPGRPGAGEEHPGVIAISACQ